VLHFYAIMHALLATTVLLSLMISPKMQRRFVLALFISSLSFFLGSYQGKQALKRVGYGIAIHVAILQYGRVRTPLGVTCYGAVSSKQTRPLLYRYSILVFAMCINCSLDVVTPKPNLPIERKSWRIV
jgi:hypothetical protein